MPEGLRSLAEIRGIYRTAESRVTALGCPSLPRHLHVASHLALVSDSRCEAEAAIATHQLLTSRRPEINDDTDSLRSSRNPHPDASSALLDSRRSTDRATPRT